MGRSFLFLVIVLLLLSVVSSRQVFYDDFEDGVEWTNWEAAGSTFSKWILNEIEEVDEGHGFYSTRSLMGNALSILELTNPVNFADKVDCEVSFYTGSFCLGNCPSLSVDFYNGSSWNEIGNIVFTEATPLNYTNYSIPNEYLHENSSIRFNSIGVGIVYVDDIDLSCSATPEMDVTLEAPYCGEYFFLGDESVVKIVAEDSDDYIEGNISIDGTVVEFTNGGVEFNYTWDRAGNIQAELSAVNTDSFRKNFIVSVMVIDPTVTGEYLAACIDEPAQFSDIASKNVYFNASSTRGIRNESGDLIIVPREDLLFTWEFSDGLINFNNDPELSNLSWNFYKNYVNTGNNWAKLDVEFK